MLSKIFSGAAVGLESVLIEVEVDILPAGLPSFSIVGLANKAVEEAKERVRSALLNSGADFPSKRITINLAPADLPKTGVTYDLAMAAGILFASKQICRDLNDSFFLGEVSLDGSLRSTPGVLPLVMLAKEKGFKKVFLPEVNADEASIIGNIEIYPIKNLEQLIAFFRELTEIKPFPQKSLSELLQRDEEHEFDLCDIVGQEQAKRVLEIAAAGGHNLLMKGVPGAGKTLLARTLPSILPNLTEEEALEVTKIYSITGSLKSNNAIVKNRPFRSPHHTISRAGLIGGGTKITPGEISLAHRGVLFLDEFPEFPRHVLESLRGPMEDGLVTVSRAAGTLSFPAKFILVSASNPCPCGFLHSSDPKKYCKCLPGQIIRYQRRVSGPIIDRIDLHIDVPQVEVDKLTNKNLQSEKSKIVRQRVQKARNRQSKRFAKTNIFCNAEMTTRDVKEFCPLSSEVLSLLRQVVSQFSLSARSYYRVIKVSRTIADLAGEKEISVSHVAEALQFRPREER